MQTGINQVALSLELRRGEKRSVTDFELLERGEPVSTLLIMFTQELCFHGCCWSTDAADCTAQRTRVTESTKPIDFLLFLI